MYRLKMYVDIKTDNKNSTLPTQHVCILRKRVLKHYLFGYYLTVHNTVPSGVLFRYPSDRGHCVIIKEKRVSLCNLKTGCCTCGNSAQGYCFRTGTLFIWVHVIHQEYKEEAAYRWPCMEIDNEMNVCLRWWWSSMSYVKLWRRSWLHCTPNH